jgi:membrane-bound lytic murein transglycosylase MltF
MGKANETAGKDINRKTIQSKIHPNQWRDEVDRVAPQLQGKSSYYSYYTGNLKLTYIQDSVKLFPSMR